jgi:hypothetical protein
LRIWVLIFKRGSMYAIINVPDDAHELPEQLGTKFKFWYRDSTNRRILFKQGRPGTGENWAEKVCAEIASLIGLPHATYELAIWGDLRGVITPTFVPEGARLVLGNEMMARVMKGYAQTATYRAREHTLSTVLTIMQHPRLLLPVGYDPPPAIARPVDIFVGYLLLDALVANQDRHHENWALISWPGRGIMLAPTFDHASSLGRNELDESRARRLNTRDSGGNMEAYCARARSAFYSRAGGSKPLTTFEAFAEAARNHAQPARYWLDRLAATSLGQCERIVANIPKSEISSTASEFALKMIDVNRCSLLELKV